MKHLILLMALLTSSWVNATEILNWDALKPNPSQQQALSASDRALVSEIHLYEFAQQSRQLSPLEYDGNIQRIALAEKRGLDVKEAVAQMVLGEQDASAAIPALEVNDMQLRGYLIPLEHQGLIGNQFVLVPSAVACTHTPPPPANQTVLVEIPKGYQLHSLYTPVWV